MSKKRSFNLISLCLIVFQLSYVLSDSYTDVIIQQTRSVKPRSKWIKNQVNEDSCGGIFRDKQVIIKSPRYPNNYGKNLDCEYVFYSPFVCTNEFHVQFLHFELEPSISCSKDKVRIGAEEVLCGQVIGIMKYKGVNGTLRIKFTSDDTIENKGFELLVSRLPCANVSTKENLGEETVLSSNNLPSITESHSMPSHSDQVKQNNAIVANPHTIPNPNAESIPETSVVKPVCVPKETWSTVVPQVTQFPSAPPTLPSCCINVYNQQRFYLMSPGFPNAPPFSNDCLFFIERFHSNTCRLRIEFKYFLLGDWQHQRCTNSFIEIDGQRFCGCRTGFTYYTQWGASPKTIRFVNTPMYTGMQGFVVEVTQEECPYRSVASLPIQNIALPPRNNLVNVNDPRRCTYSYISWLNFNTNQELLAKSICIRNRNYG